MSHNSGLFADNVRSGPEVYQGDGRHGGLLPAHGHPVCEGATGEQTLLSLCLTVTLSQCHTVTLSTV